MFALWVASLVGGDGYVDALGNPVGGDFPMFYIAGQMACRGEWSLLYNEPQQQARLLQLLPTLPPDTYLPFRYPPLVAILSAPLAMLPYPAAFIVFASTSLVIWLGGVGHLVRRLIPQPDAATGTAILALAAAPVMLQSLIDGQASICWFAIASACWCSLVRGRAVAAGCWLALAACKPNVMLLLGGVLVVRHPRMLIGASAVGGALAILTCLIAGTDPLVNYVELAWQLALAPWQVETPYWKVQSLLSWTELAVGTSLARRTNLVVGLVSAACVALWWRRQPHTQAADAQALSIALVINALFNPYTPVYDLTLLCLGGIVCVASVAGNAWPGTSSAWLSRRDVAASLAVLLVAPVASQSMAKALGTPLQAMPLCLLALTTYWLAFPWLFPLFERPAGSRRPAASAANQA